MDAKRTTPAVSALKTSALHISPAGREDAAQPATLTD